jgi:hypothetical protein
MRTLAITTLTVTLFACSSAPNDAATATTTASNSSASTSTSTSTSTSSTSSSSSTSGGVGGAGGGAATPQKKLCGLYLLSSKAGTFQDGNIRDYDFIDGYSVRVDWSDLESTQGVYQFDLVDHLLGRLEPLGQGLNFELMDSPPDYVLQGAQTTWSEVDDNPNHPTFGQTIVHPVPWDAFAQQRFGALLTALSTHMVSYQGKPISVSEHPLFRGMNIGLPGWQGIRDKSTHVKDFPGYTRDTLKTAILSGLHTQTAAFPTTPIHLGFWKVNDATASPSLWEDLRATILNEFDSPNSQPIGFFQENLAYSVDKGVETGRPTTDYAAPLYESRKDTFIAFQANTAWTAPFPGHESVVVGGTPVQGMHYAMDTFGAKYIEFYLPDADAAQQGTQPWLDDFRAIHKALCAP